MPPVEERTTGVNDARSTKLLFSFEHVVMFSIAAGEFGESVWLVGV